MTHLWKDLDAEVALRLAALSDGERAVFSAGVAERLMRAHEALPAPARRPFTLGLRPLLAAVWTGALGDTSAFPAIKSGLGSFYLSEYCHNNGEDGPDDAQEPAAAAVLHAARAYMHGCADFALFASGEGLQVAARLAAEVGWESEDPDEIVAEELRRQLRDLDHIAGFATDLRRARFGLEASTTAHLRTGLREHLSRPDDLS